MTRDELKAIDWNCVLSDQDSWTGLDGSFILPILCEKMAASIEACSDGIGAWSPRFSLLDLLLWAIDNGYFDADLSAGSFDKYRAEQEAHAVEIDE